MVTDDQPDRSRAADPRPARTRAAVFAAIESLSVRHDEGTEFTISAILRESGISRGAFYTHFPTMEDLAEQILEDRFQKIGRSDRAQRRVDVKRAARDPESSLRRPAQESQLEIARFLRSHRAFFRASLDWRVSSRVHETVVSMYAREIRATLALLGPAVPRHIDPHAFSLMIAGGSIAIQTAWLREAEPATPEVLAERLLAAMPEWFVGAHKPLQNAVPPHAATEGAISPSTPLR
jgi:AcrR family transcriptional regulator